MLMARHMQAAARLSSKSQVVIPKAVRDRMGIGPGDTLLFEVRDGEIVVRRAPRMVADDPFAVFTEWPGPADTKAYDDF